jgi:hypothetical protein
VLTLVAVAAVSFLTGLIVGIALREGFALARTGHTRAMRVTPYVRRFAVSARRFGVARGLAIVLVVAALLSNAFVGVLQVQNGRHDRQRAECGITYSKAQSRALHDRAGQANAITRSERKIWKTLDRDIRRHRLTNRSLHVAIRKHVGELDATLANRAAHPFPAPGFCKVNP